jgi:dihydrofolate reductase
MRKLSVFNTISIDGYFTDLRGDLSWAHKDDPEWNEWVRQNASGDGVLMFGRTTYELMAKYWPTPLAAKNNPAVAKYMNERPKIVVSYSIEKPDWNNTTRVRGDLPAAVRRLKQESGDDICILGSGSIIAQLASERLIDAYQLAVSPVVLGEGKTLFEGVKERLGMKLTFTRAFGNGNVLTCYEPA